MKKKHKKIIYGILTSIIALVLIVLDETGYIDLEKYLDSSNKVITESNAYTDVNKLNEYKVVRVVDGDTFVIEFKGKQEKVRLIGVDTPESVHPTKGVEYYGKEASDYTCNLVKNAKKIEIEYDDNSDKVDKYDRLLVWVFVDGELLQKKLIENGYAKVAYLYDDYKYTSELQKVQEKVSAQNIGVWNETAKNEYNKKNNIEEEIEEEATITDNLTSEIDLAIKKIKQFKLSDYIILSILLIIIIFCSNKKI